MENQTKRWAVAAGFGTVAFLGLAMFALAVGTFKDRLRAPFGLTPAGAGDLKGLSFEPDTSDLLAQTKDTDRDGLPDAQELQVYKTSPFLEDTDSDGTGDRAEIEAGEDPNCPKGVECRVALFPPARQFEQQEITRKLYESTLIPKLVEFGIPGLSDATSIRNLLRQAGIPENVLSQFDDGALRAIFEQASGGTAASAPSGPQRAGALPSTLPSNPSPQAIRELLLRGGVDKTLIDRFSDEQLIELYQKTLVDVNTNQ